jgi:hypothetical protein
MVAINFSERFAGAVERGEKRQTIRREARCKPGDQLQLYTGQRTKHCRKLRDAVCLDVAPISITRGTLTVNGSVYMSDTAAAFARADGFSDYDDMWNWFYSQYKQTLFTGHVIKW